MSQVHFSDVLVGLISNAVFLGICLLFRKARAQFQRQRRALREICLALIGVLYIAANLGYYYYLPFRFDVFFLMSSLVIGWLVSIELYQFWRIGLMGADRTIADGLGFKESLQLCKNSLEFMGVGAAKLTGEGSVFEDAIARCHRDNKAVRFLLCDPTSNKLIEMAKQANKPEHEYQENTKKSLRILAEMKNKRARNIEVRFYKDLPLFRLMFIDDVLCLASHYVFGEGNGSQLPQLHIRRPTHSQRDVETLYHPFRGYFERVWKESTPWDFQSGLQ